MDLTGIIPAAGLGSRLKQLTPKGLTPVQQSSFLEIQLRKLSRITKSLWVVVSKENRLDFENFRTFKKLQFEIVEQVGGQGSFFALKSVVDLIHSEFACVLWCDQIGVSPGRILENVNLLRISQADGILPLHWKESPYVQATILDNKLLSWKYDIRNDPISSGYTDLGISIFKTQPLQTHLKSQRLHKLLERSQSSEVNFLDTLPSFSENYDLQFSFSQDEVDTFAVNTPYELEVAQKIDFVGLHKLIYSIIIPAYNEAHRIRSLLDELKEVRNRTAEQQEFQVEIVFVDDGSSDNTKQIVSQYPFKYVYQENSGKGSAVKRGVAESKGHFVIVLDADNEYQVRDALRLVEMSIKNPFACVYGSRYLSPVKRKIRLVPIKGQSLLNFAFNYILSLLIYLRFGAPITDSLTGLKLYPRSVYGFVDPKTRGFETDHEITKSLLSQSFPIIEVAVSYHPRNRQEGKKIRLTDAWKAIKQWII